MDEFLIEICLPAPFPVVLTKFLKTIIIIIMVLKYQDASNCYSRSKEFLNVISSEWLFEQMSARKKKWSMWLFLSLPLWKAFCQPFFSFNDPLFFLIFPLNLK